MQELVSGLKSQKPPHLGRGNGRNGILQKDDLSAQRHQLPGLAFQ